MSKKDLSPIEQAENIILRAMETAETNYKNAIAKEEGELSRLDLDRDYAETLFALAQAMKSISADLAVIKGS